MTNTPVMQMPPHLERMYQEKNELEIKMNKLSDFIVNNPAYSELPDFQKALMLIQMRSMETYLECLRQRLIFS